MPPPPDGPPMNALLEHARHYAKPPGRKWDSSGVTTAYFKNRAKIDIQTAIAQGEAE